MNNVRCKKLVIDRSRAPSKLGTLKDISLFGNFKFPSSGPYADGITLQSLAGTGRALNKTKTQLSALSSRTTPIARNTGAVTTEDIWEDTDTLVRGDIGSCGSGAYSVNFIQQPSHAHPIVPSHLVPNQQVHHHEMKPQAAFALKKGGAKRVTFSEEQKQIMIYFYDRQKNLQIRANPKEVIEHMKSKGVPELKEAQIKSWWGSYHRKQKQLAEDLLSEAQQMVSQQGLILILLLNNILLQSAPVNCTGQ